MNSMLAAIVAAILSLFGQLHPTQAPQLTYQQPAASVAAAATAIFTPLSTPNAPAPSVSSVAPAPTTVIYKYVTIPAPATPQLLADANLGTTSASILDQLQTLGEQLQSEIASLPSSNTSPSPYLLTVPAWAASQRINNLSGVTISNSTIDSASIPDLSGKYLSLNGGAVTGTTTFSGGIIGPNNFIVQQGSGNVGIGTANPAATLDVNGTVQASSTNIGTFVSEKSFTVTFPDGVANQKVQIYWPTGARIQGGYEVTVASGYYGGDASGMIRKTFGVYGYEGGSLYLQQTDVPLTLGPTANYFTISNILWDATNSRWYIVIPDLTAAGNSITIDVKSYVNPVLASTWYNARASAMQVGQVYSSDTTIYPKLQNYFSSNLGIGTTSPLAELDVAGANNGTSPLLQLSSVASFATTTRFIVTNSGNVGIGTTTPATTLSTQGNEYTTGGLGVGVLNTTAGTLQTSGNATIGGCVNYNGGTSGTCLSDERVKQDINTFTPGLQDIVGLNPVTYQYNGLAGTPKDGDVRTGLIAQQVQQAAPDLVATTSAFLNASDTAPTQLFEVNYGSLPFVLINAVKEIAAISGGFQTNLIAWLGNASNGIDDLFAKNLFASNVTADNITAKNTLCLASGANDNAPVCITKAQLAAILAATNQSSANGGLISDSSSGSTASTTPDTPPVIQINGNNLSVIKVGAIYDDLGVTIIGPQADLNLGITTYVNGAKMSPVQLDTTQAATDTVQYVVTDSTGLTATSTRTIVIQASAQNTSSTSSGTATTSLPAANNNEATSTPATNNTTATTSPATSTQATTSTL